jgi:hypothetical protein
MDSKPGTEPPVATFNASSGRPQRGTNLAYSNETNLTLLCIPTAASPTEHHALTPPALAALASPRVVVS